jgi:predicted solute-binding protein
MTMKSILGIPSNVMCGLLRRVTAGQSLLQVTAGSTYDIAGRLRRSELAGAMVSPIEFARESSVYRIVPDFTISSRNGVSVCFRKGLKNVTTLAADPAAAAEIVLARIVMAEEFEVSPAIVPVQPGSVEHMLSRADAALLSGDLLLDAGVSSDCIDLVDIWCDMVELPFVHTLLCSRDGALPGDVLQQIHSAGATLLSGSVMPPPADSAGGRDQEAVNAYLRAFTYGMTPDVQEGLREFLHYAHYYGILPDIPELMFYEADSGEASSPN